MDMLLKNIFEPDMVMFKIHWHFIVLKAHYYFFPWVQTRKDEDFEFHVFKQWTAASCKNTYCDSAPNGQQDMEEKPSVDF